eukprot:1055820-Karenia_brevis.AAC.1
MREMRRLMEKYLRELKMRIGRKRRRWKRRKEIKSEWFILKLSPKFQEVSKLVRMMCLSIQGPRRALDAVL